MRDLTEISVILDRSGSMEDIKEATIQGYNSFILNQRTLPGEATVSLYQFDDKYETSYSNVNVKYASLLTNETYQPRGNTSLWGAIGKTIDNLGLKLANLPENDRPNKILVVIQTDGFENHSHLEEWSKQYTFAKVAEMIKHQREKYNWEFVFVGANQDAILTGGGLNIPKSACLNYVASSVGTAAAFNCVSSYTKSYRQVGKASF